MDNIWNMITARLQNALILNFLLVFGFQYKYEFAKLFWGEGLFNARLAVFQRFFQDEPWYIMYGLPFCVAIVLTVFLPALKLPVAWLSGAYDTWINRFHGLGQTHNYSAQYWELKTGNLKVTKAFKVLGAEVRYVSPDQLLSLLDTCQSRSVKFTPQQKTDLRNRVDSL